MVAFRLPFGVCLHIHYLRLRLVQFLIMSKDTHRIIAPSLALKVLGNTRRLFDLFVELEDERILWLHLLHELGESKEEL